MNSQISKAFSPHKSRRRRMGYREAIKWLACNDDCAWAEDEDSPQSVTAAFVADCFDVNDAKVRRDLQRAIPKQES